MFYDRVKESADDTNMAIGLRTGRHSHQEVVAMAERSSERLCAWMEALLKQWHDSY